MSSSDSPLKIKISKPDLSLDTDDDQLTPKRNFYSDKKQQNLVKSQISASVKSLCSLISNMQKSDESTDSQKSGNVDCASSSKSFCWSEFLQPFQTVQTGKGDSRSLKRKNSAKVSHEFESNPKKKIKQNSERCVIENKDFVKECSNNPPQEPGDEQTQPSSQSTSCPFIDISVPLSTPKELVPQTQNFSMPMTQMIPVQFGNGISLGYSYPSLSNFNMLEIPQNVLGMGSLFNGNMVIGNFVNPGMGMRSANPWIMNINSVPHIVINPFPTYSFYN